MRRAFTMIELVFIIVIIGILTAIAIPKFNITRDDATITKARTTVASVRSSLSSEVQRRILRGDYTQIQNVGGAQGYDVTLFDYFDSNSSDSRVLEYPIKSCIDANAKGCWVKSGDSEYKFIFPASMGGEATFEVINNRFECKEPDSSECKLLER